MSFWEGVADLIKSAVDIIDGFHDVPSADSSANSQMRDVIGNKNDVKTTDSLVGIAKDNLSETENLESHFHNRECWRGKRAVQTATNWADDVLTSFRAISGNNTWGADANDEAKTLGTGDTPFIVGKTLFDVHRILITGVSSNNPYKARVIWGSGTMAEAIAANQWSCFMFHVDSTNPQFGAGVPVDIICPQLRSGIDQVWFQAWNGTDNAWFDFNPGIHEYD